MVVPLRLHHRPVMLMLSLYINVMIVIMCMYERNFLPVSLSLLIVIELPVSDLLANYFAAGALCELIHLVELHPHALTGSREIILHLIYV